MKAIVVIPTYDERDALPRLVDAILRQPGAFHILVVDDNSPDGTGTVADALASSWPDRVAVVHRRRKEGLGRAYADGFARAIADGADLVFQMDADGSHDPAALVSSRALIERGSVDLVIGSRYCSGGGVEGWGLGRRMLSRWGSLYARVILGVQVRDLTSGYKAWRADLLEVVTQRSVGSRGYAFQVEMTLRAVDAGARIGELPIVFTERSAGRSKMTPSIVLEAAWRVPWLAVARPKVREYQRVHANAVESSSPERLS